MTLEELAQRVQVLEDIEAIKKLKARYCAAADSGDEEAFVGCFSGDATWDGGSFGRYEGRDAIRGLFKSIPNAISFAVHYVMNPQIDVEGQQATGRWYLLEPCTMVEGGEQAVWGSAFYDEDYIKTDSGWKIANLTLTQAFWSPFDQGWVKHRFVGQ